MVRTAGPPREFVSLGVEDWLVSVNVGVALKDMEGSRRGVHTRRQRANGKPQGRGLLQEGNGAGAGLARAALRWTRVFEVQTHTVKSTTSVVGCRK
jgi:hypothetical protein